MSSRWISAIVAGMAGGFAMLVCMMVGASNAGMPWDSPLRWIASLLMSEPALIMAGKAAGGVSTAACLALGLSIHLIVAVAFARLFLMTVDSLRGWRLLPAGIAYGVVIWAIMTFGVLRLVNDVMYARVKLVSTVFFGAHLLYGSILAGIAAGNLRSTQP
jgi:hypothetical protein